MKDKKHNIAGMDYILERYAAGHNEGEMESVCLFTDISGFTELTAELMRSGPAGAEKLSQFINGVFSLLVESVYSYGGFIPVFAGDAFYAIFPGDKKLHAVAAALYIRETIKMITSFHPELSSHVFAVRTGLSSGLVRWKIRGIPGKKFYYFDGPAIKSAAFNQGMCEKGQIMADRIFASATSGAPVTWADHLARKILVNAQLPFEPVPVATRSLPATAQDFYLYNRTSGILVPGEFRKIVSVFVNFEKEEDHEDTIDRILSLSEEYDAFFNMVDFGDKGPLAYIILGAPKCYEDDERRAVMFAKDLVRDRKGIRAGISSGIAYFGIVGSLTASVYTALGKEVNLAARLMQKAEQGSVLVSASVRDAAGKHFKMEANPPMPLKGIGEKVRTYTAREEIKEIWEGRGKKYLYGREKEMQSVKSAMLKVYGGSFGGIVVIYGEPGMGKTSFLKQLEELLEPGTKTVYMKTDSILRKSLFPFMEFFGSYFGSDKGTADRASFESAWSTLTEASRKIESLSDELALRKPYIKHFLGLDDGSALTEMDHKQVTENIFWGMKAVFKAMSLTAPLVIILEDIQWLDRESSAFLKKFLINLDEHPVLLIATSRYNDDGSAPVLSFPKDIPSRVIELRSLAREDLERIIADNLGNSPSGELLEAISERSFGNPFFTEQITLYLRENALIKVRAGIAFLSGDMNALPGNINTILTSRVDRLSGELKQIMRSASVLGNEFNIVILSRMLRGEDLTEPLNDGAKEQVWEKVSNIKYIFSHALLRETVYGMQLHESLKKLHIIAAEAFEELYPEEALFDIAFHYDKAASSVKAREYIEKAFKRSERTEKNDEALYCAEAALKYASDEKDILIWEERVAIYKTVFGQWNEAQAIREKILGKLPPALTEFKMSVIKSLIDIYSSRGDTAKADDLIARTFRDIETQDVPRYFYYAAVQENVSNEYFKGNYDKVLALSDKILEELGSVKNEYYGAFMYNKAMAYMNTGRFAKSLECFKEALEAVGSPGNRIRTNCNIGLIYYSMGEHEKAEQVLLETLASADKLGMKPIAGHLSGSLSFMYSQIGDPAAAQRYAVRSAEISLEIGDKRGLCRAYCGLGGLLVNKRRYREALEYFVKIRKLNEEIGSLEYDIVADLGMGECYRGMKKFHKGLSAFKDARSNAHKCNDSMNEYQACNGLFRIYYSQTEYRKALNISREAAAIARRMNDTAHLADQLVNAGEVFFMMRDYIRALRSFKAYFKLSSENNFDVFRNAYFLMTKTLIKNKLIKEKRDRAVLAGYLVKALEEAKIYKDEKQISRLEKLRIRFGL